MTEWLSTAQLAAERGVSRWTVRSAIANGSLVAYRHGRHEYQIDRADADRWIEKCRVKVKPRRHIEREHGADVFDIARKAVLR
jgi:excisionase family DNA binding protein